MSATLILASASQGRRELLEEAGYKFEVRVAPEGVEERAVSEARAAGLDIGELALAAARAKADAVAAGACADQVVVAADTVARAADGSMLGKGHDPESSKAILRRLSGTVHHVISGAVVIGRGRRREFIVSTAVKLAEMSEAEIDGYVASGRSVGASGGYRIQRHGTDRYLSIVEGTLSNVVGLPLEEIMPVLAEMGVQPESKTGF